MKFIRFIFFKVEVIEMIGFICCFDGELFVLRSFKGRGIFEFFIFVINCRR